MEQARPPSLRLSLTKRLASVLAAIGAVAALAAYALGSNYANLAYDRALADDVATLAEQVSSENGSVQVTVPAAALKWLAAGQGELVLYRVTDMRSKTLVASNGDLGELPAESAMDGQPAYRDIRRGAHKLRVAYMLHRLAPDDRPVLIEIGETTDQRDQMTRAILGTTIVFMAILIAVAVGLVWAGVGTALAPLELVAAEARQRSGANLLPLDPLHAPEEVRGLIEAINRLMARVASVLESQSHFIANAAHQLRTPLAGLSLQAQLAAKATTPEARRASLSEVEASAARAAHLVEQLLALSRAEAADLASESQAVDLGAVARQVIERYLPLADRRGMDLGYDGGSGSFAVAGSELLFAELLGNLVDNALRYGDAGGRVTLGLEERGAEILVSVSDDGPGFAEKDRERVFQRFYRSDAAARGGAGLGLAVVREIAERYHGRLSLITEPGEGSRFELHFPRYGV